MGVCTRVAPHFMYDNEHSLIRYSTWYLSCTYHIPITEPYILQIMYKPSFAGRIMLIMSVRGSTFFTTPEVLLLAPWSAGTGINVLTTGSSHPQTLVRDSVHQVRLLYEYSQRRNRFRFCMHGKYLTRGRLFLHYHSIFILSSGT